MNDNKPILTVRDLMGRWGCSRRSVLDVIHGGELRAFRIGKRTLRIRLVDLERYEAERS